MLEQNAQVVGTMRRQSAVDSSRPLLFQSIDSRILLVVWAVFIVVAISVPKFALGTALAFAAFPFFVIIACGLPALRIAKRMLMLCPFILLVASANPFLDTDIVVEIAGFPVSSGMLSASVIIIKALISLSAVLALVELISFNAICDSLVRMGVPEVFTTQLVLVYRYMFLLSDEAESLAKARELRCFDGRGKGICTTAGMIGSLLVRSVSRSDRIYKAMLARGYNGTFIRPDEKGIGAADIVLAIFACASFFLIRIFI